MEMNVAATAESNLADLELSADVEVLDHVLELLV
jgi:hypothetical protein